MFHPHGNAMYMYCCFYSDYKLSAQIAGGFFLDRGVAKKKKKTAISVRIKDRTTSCLNHTSSRKKENAFYCFVWSDELSILTEGRERKREKEKEKDRERERERKRMEERENEVF